MFYGLKCLKGYYVIFMIVIKLPQSVWRSLAYMCTKVAKNPLFTTKCPLATEVNSHIL